MNVHLELTEGKMKVHCETCSLDVNKVAQFNAAALIKSQNVTMIFFYTSLGF